ncbi:RNA polymerase sigma-70 factor [Niabella terrae]
MSTVIDEEYFTEIFNRYHDIVFTGLLNKTKNEQTALDLTQLTFIKFWKYRDSFNEHLSVEQQLFRKGKQVLIDWLRKEAHQKKLVSQLHQVQQSQRQYTAFEYKDQLNQAIEMLPLVRKKVFVMAYIDGLSHREIADMLNISVKTVDAHVLKALQQLRKIFSLSVISVFLHTL